MLKYLFEEVCEPHGIQALAWGGTLIGAVNYGGWIPWDADAANRHDNTFHDLISPFEDTMLVLTDHGFYAKAGNPSNLRYGYVA